MKGILILKSHVIYTLVRNTFYFHYCEKKLYLRKKERKRERKPLPQYTLFTPPNKRTEHAQFYSKKSFLAFAKWRRKKTTYGWISS
jgi:hypothetical protein